MKIWPTIFCFKMRNVRPSKYSRPWNMAYLYKTALFLFIFLRALLVIDSPHKLLTRRLPSYSTITLFHRVMLKTNIQFFFSFVSRRENCWFYLPQNELIIYYRSTIHKGMEIMGLWYQFQFQLHFQFQFQCQGSNARVYKCPT